MPSHRMLSEHARTIALCSLAATSLLGCAASDSGSVASSDPPASMTPGNASSTAVSPADPDSGAASPENVKERAQRLAWTRATEGLDFDGPGGRLDITPVAVTSPEEADAARAEGDRLLAGNRFVDAVGAYGLALRHDPTDLDAYRGLAMALVPEGRSDLAVAVMKTAADRAEGAKRDDLRVRLGELQWSIGAYDAAYEELSSVVEDAPDHGVAHARLAIWSYYRNDDAAAWRHVGAARANGATLPPQFIDLLERRTPAPRG